MPQFEKRFIPPRSDLMFKKVFANPHNLAPLRSLPSAALDLPLDDLGELTLLSTHLGPVNAADKESIVDVRVRTPNGQDIDIEIQRSHVRGFQKRLIFYGANMLASHLGSGDSYATLAQAIVITITDFVLVPFSDTDFRHTFFMYDPTHHVSLTDVLEVNILELPKLPKADDGTLLWKWLRFIGARDRKELDMAATLDPVIEEAVSTVRFFTEEESMQILHLQEQMALHDKASRDEYEKELEERLASAEQRLADAQSALAGAEHELTDTRGTLADAQSALATLANTQETLNAAQEALSNADRNARVAIARAMAAKGMTADMIAELTHLSASELDGL